MSNKLVSEMWKQIGHKDPITTTESVTLFETCCTLADHDIGALIVLSKEGQLRGVISERDIVKANARKVDLSVTPVSQIMTKKVISVTSGATHDECKKLMNEENIRHLPVIQDEVVLGMVSMKDIIRSDEYDARIEKDHMEGYLKRAG